LASPTLGVFTSPNRGGDPRAVKESQSVRRESKGVKGSQRQFLAIKGAVFDLDLRDGSSSSNQHFEPKPTLATLAKYIVLRHSIHSQSRHLTMKLFSIFLFAAAVSAVPLGKCIHLTQSFSVLTPYLVQRQSTGFNPPTGSSGSITTGSSGSSGGISTGQGSNPAGGGSSDQGGKSSSGGGTGQGIKDATQGKLGRATSEEMF
jgi:hypothetical protein